LGKKPSSLLIEHDGFIHFDERPLDHRLRQPIPLQYLIIERHQHFELSERYLPKVLVFEKEIEFERGFGLFSSWKREKTIGDKVARFRQLNVDKPNVHHDALEFPNGDIVLVTRLCEGQHATVLQLPASPHSVNREVELRHAPFVG
jgi:hypothetical protein